MKTFKEWLKLKNEGMGGGFAPVIGNNAKKPQDAGGIWGGPETAGKDPAYAQASMQKSLKKGNKK